MTHLTDYIEQAEICHDAQAQAWATGFRPCATCGIWDRMICMDGPHLDDDEEFWYCNECKEKLS
jgi:hypothetical protein